MKYFDNVARVIHALNEIQGCIPAMGKRERKQLAQALTPMLPDNCRSETEVQGINEISIALSGLAQHVLEEYGVEYGD